MYGIIYKATNTVNGKVYIGLTKNGLQRRRYEHELASKLRKNGTHSGKYYFQNALWKYGFDLFEWEVIDTADTLEELRELEMFWISYYGSYGKHGYNLTAGGEDQSNTSKEVYVFSVDGELLQTYESATEASADYGCRPGDIGRVANGKLHVRNNKVFLFSEDWDSLKDMQQEVQKRKKKIHDHQERSGGKQIVAINSKLECYEFRSIYAVSKETTVCRRTIRHILNKKSTGTKEWTFRYKKDIPQNDTDLAEFMKPVKAHFEHQQSPATIPNPITQKKKPSRSRVFQYTLNGTFVRSYKDIFELTEDLHIKNYTNVFQCSRGVKSQAFGFLWLLESDFMDKNERKKEILQRAEAYKAKGKKHVPIIALYPCGRIQTFPTKMACAKELNMTRATVLKKIRDGSECKDGSRLFEEHSFEDYQKALVTSKTAG